MHDELQKQEKEEGASPKNSARKQTGEQNGRKKSKMRASNKQRREKKRFQPESKKLLFSLSFFLVPSLSSFVLVPSPSLSSQKVEESERICVGNTRGLGAPSHHKETRTESLFCSLETILGLESRISRKIIQQGITQRGDIDDCENATQDE